MRQLQKYLDPTELTKLEGLQLRVRAIVDGLLAGRHRSAGRGLSLEFSEHREYSPGDDLRHIDWKVFGRTDKHYLKQFEDEANLSCYFLLDASESMSFRGPPTSLSKFEYATCLIGSIAWLVQQRQDAVGLATFGTAVRDFLPAKTQGEALFQMLEIMDGTPPSESADTCRAVGEFVELLQRRSVVFFISDCLNDAESTRAALQQLHYHRHDAMLLHVLDPHELDFPFTRQTIFEGMEGSADITTDAAAIAASYRKRVEAFCTELRKDCGDNQIRYVLCRTDQPFDRILPEFLHV